MKPLFVNSSHDICRYTAYKIPNTVVFEDVNLKFPNHSLLEHALIFSI